MRGATLDTKHPNLKGFVISTNLWRVPIGLSRQLQPVSSRQWLKPNLCLSREKLPDSLSCMDSALREESCPAIGSWSARRSRICDRKRISEKRPPSDLPICELLTRQDMGLFGTIPSLFCIAFPRQPGQLICSLLRLFAVCSVYLQSLLSICSLLRPSIASS